MRALTRMQASVIDSILSEEDGTQRERIRKSGLAPRTYQVARNRALEAQWVAERLVPDPVVFARPRATVAMAHLATSGDLAAGARWAAMPGASVVWATPRSLFGVFFDADGEDRPAIVKELARTSTYSKSYSLALDLRRPSLPVYFDFEAEWAQVAGIPGVSAYPRPFPRRHRVGGRTPPPPSDRWRRAVEEVVRNDAIAPPAGAERETGWSLRASEARALASGWVDRRSFLSPARLPPYDGWELQQVVFVTGRLRRDRRPEILLRTLVVAGHVHPFLFATNGTELMLATLSPPPSPNFSTPPRLISVGATLDRYLEGIEVVRETISDLDALVNHRYERILGIGLPGGEASTPALGTDATVAAPPPR